MDTFWMISGTLTIIGVLLLFDVFVKVESGTVAYVFRLGKFVGVLQPGLKMKLPIIEKVEHHSTQVHQHELPAEPEFIDRVSNNPPPGMAKPFRIMHASKEEAIYYIKKPAGSPDIDPSNPLSQWQAVSYKKLPAAIRNSMGAYPIHAPVTSEIAAVVEWNLVGTDFEANKNFVENVSPEEGRDREEEVRKRISDMAERALQAMTGPSTLGHVTANLDFFSLMFKQRVEALVGETSDPVTGQREKPWGIHIKDAYLKPPYAGETINRAQSEAAASISHKQNAIRTAEAEAARIRLESEANADATRVSSAADAFAEEQKGKGEAARITAMAQAMKDPDAKFLAALDVAETALPKSRFVVVPSDVGAIASVLTLGQALGEAAPNKVGNADRGGASSEPPQA